MERGSLTITPQCHHPNNPALKGVVDFAVSLQGDDTQTVFSQTVEEDCT